MHSRLGCRSLFVVHRYCLRLRYMEDLLRLSQLFLRSLAFLRPSRLSSRHTLACVLLVGICRLVLILVLPSALECLLLPLLFLVPFRHLGRIRIPSCLLCQMTLVPCLVCLYPILHIHLLCCQLI